MAHYLGIDGGGTGCRAAIAGEDGTVLGTATAGPANIASDPDGAARNILAAARAALVQAGLSEDEVPALCAGLGLAGANSEGAVERLRDALPFSSARIETDAVAAAMGALGKEDGIVAALGTGSVFAVQHGGIIRQIGGWGLVLGDEGSGAWIGRALCAAALRAEDGFVPMTPLLRGLLDKRGGPLGLVAFSLSARPADFASLAPLALDAEDPTARAIMGRAEADVAEAVDHLQTADGFPVVFLGGLGPVMASRLARRWTIRASRGSALDGALQLARGGLP